MAWLILVVAGLLEIVWAYTMKLSLGFTRLWPSIITLVAMIASFGLLAQGYVMKTIRLGLVAVDDTYDYQRERDDNDAQQHNKENGKTKHSLTCFCLLGINVFLKRFEHREIAAMLCRTKKTHCRCGILTRVFRYVHHDLQIFRLFYHPRIMYAI